MGKGILDKLNERHFLKFYYVYFCSCVNYVPEPENSALLRCALGVFRKFSRFPEALRLALMLNDMELVEDIFTSCKDVYVEKLVKK